METIGLFDDRGDQEAESLATQGDQEARVFDSEHNPMAGKFDIFLYQHLVKDGMLPEEAAQAVIDSNKRRDAKRAAANSQYEQY